MREIRCQHACSTVYKLFIILSITILMPCTLNERIIAHGAIFAADDTDAVSAAAAASSSKNDEFDLHVSHITIDTLVLTSTNGQDLSHLVFEPSIINFDELSVGETASRIVTLINKHANRSVYLGSISGTVPDFYSSFFEQNVVPPMGNTTFNVVFLPRQQTTVQAHLVIHTSFGVINYEVKGKGVECPYRLSPLIGLKAPMNATLTPEIYMYNPYDTPLQIVEVYSSGGQFQLELPTSNSDETSSIGTSDTDSSRSNSAGERSQTIWEIPPYCTKPVIRVRFTATTAGNHTAYIRIKVSARNKTELENSVIVLPIEVEIFKQHGIYSCVPFLNFGLAGTNDQPKSFLFKLLNSGKDVLDIDSYSVEAEPDVKNSVTLEVDTVVDTVKNETYRTMTATVNWSKVKAERFFRGNILIQTKSSESNNEHFDKFSSSSSTKTSSKNKKNSESFYKIPFVGEIIRGSIYYNESLTKFQTSINGEDKPSTLKTRDFRLKNNFDIALAVTNLTIPNECSQYFRIDNFHERILAPGEESILFQITQLPAALKQSASWFIHLHTNVSLYDIELFSFNGLLKRLVPISERLDFNLKNIDTEVDEKTINFGTLPLSAKSSILLAMVNQNPIPISIQNWKGTISSAAHIDIILRGCSKLSMTGLKFCNSIKPGEWTVFQVSVTSNAVGTFVGKFTVKTDYEEISTPVRFSTDMGLLDFRTKMIDRENCFPVSTLIFFYFISYNDSCLCLCKMSSIILAEFNIQYQH